MNENDKFDIIVSFHLDEETAEKLAKRLTSFKDKMSAEELVACTLLIFGAVNVSNVTYTSTKGVGHVALEVECSKEQAEKNRKEAEEVTE
jgi:hypothetical protein